MSSESLQASEENINTDPNATLKIVEQRVPVATQISESALPCGFKILSQHGLVSVRRLLGKFSIDFNSQTGDNLCLGDLINVQEGSLALRVGQTELSIQKNSQVVLSQVNWDQKNHHLITLRYGTVRIWSTQTEPDGLNFDEGETLVNTANILVMAFNADYLLSVPFESLSTAVTVLMGSLFLRPLQIKEKLEILFGPLDKSNWVRFVEGASFKVITEKDENEIPTHSNIKYYKELDHYSIQQILDQLYAQGFISYHRFLQGLSVCASISVGDLLATPLANTPSGIFTSGPDYQPYGLGLRYGFKEGGFLRLLVKLQPFTSASALHIEPLFELGKMEGRFSAGIGAGSGLWLSEGKVALRPTLSIFAATAVNIFGDAFLEIGPNVGAYLANESAGFPTTFYYSINALLNWKM